MKVTTDRKNISKQNKILTFVNIFLSDIQKIQNVCYIIVKI